MIRHMDTDNVVEIWMNRNEMINRCFSNALLVIATALAALAVTTATQASDLGVSPSGRHLTVQGKPFFWLGDTVWLLAQVPSREEIELYGNGNVWHFDTCKPELTQTWKEALRSPGAATLRHAKNFLSKIGWWKFVPDASIIAEGEGSGRTRNVAVRSVDGDALAVYFAGTATVKLRLNKITGGDNLSARWTNPATGEERPAGTVDRQTHSFTPPPDWDDALLQVAAQKRSSPKP